VVAVLVDKAEQTTLSLVLPTRAAAVAVAGVMEMVAALKEMVKRAVLA
jgi:uncharacterized membrane protein